jgi:hypothetical protein
VVVDDLSRKYEEDGSLFSISFIVSIFLKTVHQEWFQDPKLSHLIQQLQQYPHAYSRYSWNNEELHYKGHLYLIKWSHLKSTMLSKLNVSPT